MLNFIISAFENIIFLDFLLFWEIQVFLYAWLFWLRFYVLWFIKIISVEYHIMNFTMFQTTDTFTHVISGGRDRKIFMTDLRIQDRRVLVCEESAPILKMVMTPDQGSLWVATSESCIKNWVSYVLCFCLLVVQSFFYLLGQPHWWFLSVIFIIHIYWAPSEFCNYFQCFKILNIWIFNLLYGS